jgi:hypothetical protein
MNITRMAATTTQVVSTAGITSFSVGCNGLLSLAWVRAAHGAA